MKKKRHNWSNKQNEPTLGRKTYCFDCGMIRENLGKRQGYIYYFKNKDYVSFKAGICNGNYFEFVFKNLKLKK